MTHLSRFHYSPSSCGAISCFSSGENGALSNADEFATHEDEDVIYDASNAPDYVSGPISLEDPERVILGASISKAPYAHFISVLVKTPIAHLFF